MWRFILAFLPNVLPQIGQLKLPISPWTFDMCLFKCYARLKDLSQTSQLWFLWDSYPSWKSVLKRLLKCDSLRWRLKVFKDSNLLSHCWHVKEFALLVCYVWAVDLCLLKLLSVVKVSSQRSHEWYSTVSGLCCFLAPGPFSPAGVRVFPAGNLQNPEEILTKTLIIKLILINFKHQTKWPEQQTGKGVGPG